MVVEVKEGGHSHMDYRHKQLALGSVLQSRVPDA